jgi:hypothetical protein
MKIVPGRNFAACCGFQKRRVSVFVPSAKASLVIANEMFSIS